METWPSIFIFVRSRIIQILCNKELEMLDYLSEETGFTKSEIIRIGIQMQYNTMKKRQKMWPNIFCGHFKSGQKVARDVKNRLLEQIWPKKVGKWPLLKPKSGQKHSICWYKKWPKKA